MNERNFQNVPFTPGRPVVVPTSSFNREVQESIVDNYFNGTGSVYANTVDNYNSRFQTQPQQAERNMNPQPTQSATQGNAPQYSPEEIASLTKTKAMIDSHPEILTEIARRDLGYNNQPAQQQESTAGLNSAQSNTPPESASSADWWEQMTKSNDDSATAQQTTPNQNVQQPGQDSPTPSQAEQAQNFSQSMYTKCMESGLDYKEVSDFTAELLKDPNNFVELFNAYKEVEKQQLSQAQGSPPAQEQPRQYVPPVNLSEAPRPGTVPVTAPFSFGTPNQNPNSLWR